jgi:hypothetical protein
MKPYLFCRHKFHKIENHFIFEMLKKTIWNHFKKIWHWDPGSGKNWIPDPGVK